MAHPKFICWKLFDCVQKSTNILFHSRSSNKHSLLHSKRESVPPHEYLLLMRFLQYSLVVLIISVVAYHNTTTTPLNIIIPVTPSNKTEARGLSLAINANCGCMAAKGLHDRHNNPALTELVTRSIAED